MIGRLPVILILDITPARGNPSGGQTRGSGSYLEAGERRRGGCLTLETTAVRLVVVRGVEVVGIFSGVELLWRRAPAKFRRERPNWEEWLS
jgi:hypothetical protein